MAARPWKFESSRPHQTVLKYLFSNGYFPRIDAARIGLEKGKIVGFCDEFGLGFANCHLVTQREHGMTVVAVFVLFSSLLESTIQSVSPRFISMPS